MEKHLQTFLFAVMTAIAMWVGASVSELNRNVAVIIERTEAHEKRLSKLEDASSSITRRKGN